LIVYVDDRLEVSEVDELNNFELAQFAITVEAPNTVPVTSGSSHTILEDKVLTGSLTASDAEGDALTYEIVDVAANGTALITDANTGAFQYTPDENYFGPDSFTFRAFDSEFYSDPATVTITITGVNDAPVATGGQSFEANEDIPVSGQLEATDVESSILTFSLVSGPSNGTLVLNPNGSFTYTPNDNFNGTDTFVFTVCDADDLCAEQSASVSVQVGSVEDVPVAESASAATDEDTAVFGILVATDGDDDPLTYTIVMGPTNGSLSDSLPAFTYTPNANFNGTDSFTFKANDGKADSNSATISITVIPVNDAPIAAAGPDQTPLEGSAASFTGSVTDPDSGDTHTYQWDFGDGATDSGQVVSHTYADNGAFTVTLTITDLAGESSGDTLAVAVQNVAPTVDAGTGGTLDEGGTFSGSGSFTDPGTDVWIATVDYGDGSAVQSLALDADNKTFSLSHQYPSDGDFTVAVTVSDDDGGSSSGTATVAVANVAPAANDLAVSTNEDTAVGITLSATDAGGDALTYSVVASPANGSLIGMAPNLTYTPGPDFAGEDSFTFVANDGQTDSAAATVTLTVDPVNDAPVAVDDLYGTPEDVPLAVAAPGVLGNDSDVDGSALTAVLVAGPTKGSLGLNADGSFIYTPLSNVFGNVSFSYKTFDGELYSEAVTVSITVSPVNDEPVANDDAYVRTEGASLVVAAPGVLENDSDVDGDSLTAALEMAALNGAVALGTDGGFSYTPNAGFFGSDSFSYQASDNNGGSDTATVTIGVPYGFIGLLSPWKEHPLYTIKRGSAFPISWQYADPATGWVVNSENAMIEVRIKGSFSCNADETDDTVEIIKFPGNSDYRYSSGTHKLNWDTDGLGLGCYNVRIYSGLTGQFDGPFKVKIRK